MRLGNATYDGTICALKRIVLRCEKLNSRCYPRILSVAAVAVLVMPLTLTALPLTTASLAVADRDVVRDPYTAISGILARDGLSAQSISPAVTSPFFVPPPLLGGGGFPAMAIASGGGISSFAAPRFPVVFTPWVGSAFSSVNQNGTLRNVTIGATSVPEAGATAITLFGATLLGLFTLGRRYFLH